MEKVEEYKGYRVIKRWFNSIEDNVKYLKNTREVNHIFKEEEELSSHRIEGDDDFFENHTYNEALHNFEFGYDKHLVEIKNSLVEAKKYLSEFQQRNRQSFLQLPLGFTPIVPNAILGLPNSMLSQNIVKKEIPTAKIFIESCVSCFFSSKDIINYMVIVLALIDLMERKGIRCELYSVELNCCSDEEIYIRKVKLKDFAQPLNLYKIQFPIVSPDMLRRIGFDMLEVEPLITKRAWRCGYGHPLNREDGFNFELNKDKTLNKDLQFFLDAKENDLYFQGNNVMNIRESTSIDEIIEKIKEKTGILNYLKI